MDIYIKPRKKASVTGGSCIRAGDVCEIAGPPDIKERAENIKLLETDGDKKLYLVSALDIIAAIDRALPGHTVNNVGEIDVVVEYHSRAKKDRPLWKWAKIILISMIFAFGAATAIMSFHNDAEIPKVFRSYYKIFQGKDQGEPRAIQIAYSVGLAVGIIVFFNHIGGRNITDDPSPIEVEMSDYDKTVTAAIVEFLTVKKTARKKNGHGRV